MGVLEALLIVLTVKPLVVGLLLFNLTHVQRVGWERMNELVLNSAGKLKMCTMPPHHNEHFSVSITGISNLTPFNVGCLLLHTHARAAHVQQHGGFSARPTPVSRQTASGNLSQPQLIS